MDYEEGGKLENSQILMHDTPGERENHVQSIVPPQIQSQMCNGSAV